MFRHPPEEVAAASTVSIALSLLVVLLLERTIGLQEYVKL